MPDLLKKRGISNVFKTDYLCAMKKQWNGNSYKVGMLGGGQLGRMFIQEALNYDVHVHCLDPDADAPCRHLATSFHHGSLLDFETVVNFGNDKNVVTVEIEHVNVEALRELENRGVKVFPQPNVLAIVQDKGLQKQFYLQKQMQKFLCVWCLGRIGKKYPNFLLFILQAVRLNLCK